MTDFFAHLIGSSHLGLTAAAAPSLGVNLVAAAQAAQVIPIEVQDAAEALARLLAPRLREVGGLLHGRTAPGVPGQMRWRYFHDKVTEGLDPDAVAAPSADDPTGQKYCEGLARALLRELVEATARKSASDRSWTEKIDQAVAGVAKASSSPVAAADFLRLPQDLIRSALTPDRKRRLLIYAGSLLEGLADPIKGVPLLLNVVAAAGELKQPAVLQAGLNAVEAAVRQSSDLEASYRILGDAVRVSALVKDPRALVFARSRVDTALALIRLQPPRSAPNPDATIGFDDFGDLRRLALVLHEARRHLDPDLETRLFAYAHEEVGKLETEDLRKRTTLHLKDLWRQRVRPQ